MAKGKAQLPPLEAGPVPLVQIRSYAKKQLVDIIDTRTGKKALILDPKISGALLQLDAGLSELFSEHGISKLLYLERLRLEDASYMAAEPRLSDIVPVIYLARATLENAQLISWQIKNSRANKSAAQHEFSVFWVPRRSIAVERVLEDEGVYGEVTQGEFPLDLVPVDDDVLSLELDAAFRDFVLDGDPSPLFQAACGIMKLQHMYGLIPRLQGKGPAASAVKDMLVKMRKETPLPPAAAAASHIQRAILLDREVDFITPMVTQITFEGLIDEVTGIKNGSVTYTPSRQEGAAGAGSSGGPEGGRGRASGVTLLNSTDPFYKEFRDLPYYITSQRLQQYARDARKEYAELGSKDLSELKSFVKGLPKLLLLDRLSDLAVPVAEVVKQQSFHDRLKAEQDILEAYDVEETCRYITELMWRGSDMMLVLRLLVLLSFVGNGLPKKHADALRNEFLAAYGHQHLLTLTHLEKAGLLKAHVPGSSRSSGFNYAALRKGLRLVVNEPDQLSDTPGDVSFLYKGYGPISIRLVEAALKGGWGPVAEVLSMMPGGQFDSLQVLDPSGHVVDRQVKAGMAGSSAAGGVPETVLVVMLGGITFTEISALRFLASKPENNCRFLVLTTKIINGGTLLDSFVDAPARNIPRKA